MPTKLLEFILQNILPIRFLEFYAFSRGHQTRRTAMILPKLPRLSFFESYIFFRGRQIRALRNFMVK